MFRWSDLFEFAKRVPQDELEKRMAELVYTMS
jgi:hypothetical protein